MIDVVTKSVVLAFAVVACSTDYPRGASVLAGGIDVPIHVDGQDDLDAATIDEAIAREQHLTTCAYQVMGSGPHAAYVWAFCTNGLTSVSAPFALDIERGPTGSYVMTVHEPGDGSLYRRDVGHLFPPDLIPVIFADPDAYNARAAALDAMVTAKRPHAGAPRYSESLPVGTPSNNTVDR